MKFEGTTDMKRRSVMMPVSMLWNSRRVWAPVIWPGIVGNAQKAELTQNTKGNTFYMPSFGQ